MQTLEARGELDRAVEFLPDDVELAERVRRKRPLTRPELAVLLAYAKLALYDDLLELDGAGRSVSRPRAAAAISRQVIAQRFPDALEQHRLRREIIATQLANSMINRGGPTLVVRIADQTGASAAGDRARVRGRAQQLRHAGAQRARSTRSTARCPARLQLSLYAAVQNLLLDRLVWFLRNVDLTQGLAAVVEHYRKGIVDADRRRSTRCCRPEAAAARARASSELVDGRRAGATGAPHRRPAGARRGARHGADRRPHRAADRRRSRRPISPPRRSSGSTASSTAARGIVVADYFDRLALDRALDSIGDAERRLTAAMVETGRSGAAAVEAWVEPRTAEVERIRAAIAPDRRLRADAVEAHGRGEPARRSGEAVADSRTVARDSAAGRRPGILLRTLARSVTLLAMRGGMPHS